MCTLWIVRPKTMAALKDLSKCNAMLSLLRKVMVTPQKSILANNKFLSSWERKSPDVGKTPAEKIDERTACYQSKRRSEFKCLYHSPKLSSDEYIIDEDSCNPDPCVGAYPRRDKTRYQPSDKRERKYQQTWTECVKLPTIYEIPCSKEAKEFKRPRRGKTYFNIPKSACPQDGGEKMKHICALNVVQDSNRTQQGGRGCVKIELPYCIKTRKVTDCHYRPGPSNCKKYKTQYPSYSESLKPRLEKVDPRECRCMERVPLCKIWAEFNKRSNKPPC